MAPRFSKGARTPRVPTARTARTGELRRVSEAVRKFALALPGATEHFPWGEPVAKVRGKVFAFLGKAVPGGGLSMSVKLPISGEAALDVPFCKPTGYGLGKAGWVTVTFSPDDDPPVRILKAWILESYRAVAPKKFVAALDAG